MKGDQRIRFSLNVDFFWCVRVRVLTCPCGVSDCTSFIDFLFVFLCICIYIYVYTI